MEKLKEKQFENLEEEPMGRLEEKLAYRLVKAKLVEVKVMEK